MPVSLLSFFVGLHLLVKLSDASRDGHIAEFVGSLEVILELKTSVVFFNFVFSQIEPESCKTYIYCL